MARGKRERERARAEKQKEKAARRAEARQRRGAGGSGRPAKTPILLALCRVRRPTPGATSPTSSKTRRRPRKRNRNSRSGRATVELARCLSSTPSLTCTSPACRPRQRSSPGARSTSGSAAAAAGSSSTIAISRHVHPPRSDSIGVRSAPYGRRSVNVFDAAGQRSSRPRAPRRPTGVTSPACIPTRSTRYEVIVNDEIWAEGDRYDWQPGADQGLESGHRPLRQPVSHASRAIDRDPDGPVTFAIIGDFGVGIRKSTPTKRQREIGAALAPRRRRSTTCASC